MSGSQDPEAAKKDALLRELDRVLANLKPTERDQLKADVIRYCETGEIPDSMRKRGGST